MDEAARRVACAKAVRACTVIGQKPRIAAATIRGMQLTPTPAARTYGAGVSGHPVVVALDGVAKSFDGGGTTEDLGFYLNLGRRY